MRFLITSMSGFRNKGCEASTKAIINGIVKLDKKAVFKIFTKDPDYDSRQLTERSNISFLQEPFRKRYLFLGLRQFSFASKLGIFPIKKGINAFRWADAVISTGGDVFSATYGGLYKHLATIQVAKNLNKRVCLVGHSIGPFGKRSEREAFVRTMKHVELITARESLSFEYLMKMSLRGTKIELTADPAFCLEPDMKGIQRTLKTHHILGEKPIVGIAPSQSIAHWTSLSYSKHFAGLQRLIEYLVKELGYHVILIPHIREVAAKADDRIICEKLYSNINYPKNITLLSSDNSAEEIRALMSKLDLLVAERMHAAIAGLAQQVPTFVIGYSVKGQGILGDIFGFENLENYVVSIKELNEETLKKRVKNLLDKKSDITKHLSKIIPTVQSSAARNFTLVMDVLRSMEVEDQH